MCAKVGIGETWQDRVAAVTDKDTAILLANDRTNPRLRSSLNINMAMACLVHRLLNPGTHSLVLYIQLSLTRCILNVYKITSVEKMLAKWISNQILQLDKYTNISCFS